ncbi:hypothetical protein O6H91_Y338000 [Diphasiastrum complanatum]|nr:hypothetical protein O6H91_Y338000 [Diphasiastrum complanatum]
MHILIFTKMLSPSSSKIFHMIAHSIPKHHSLPLLFTLPPLWLSHPNITENPIAENLIILTNLGMMIYVNNHFWGLIQSRITSFFAKQCTQTKGVIVLEPEDDVDIPTKQQNQ